MTNTAVSHTTVLQKYFALSRLFTKVFIVKYALKFYEIILLLGFHKCSI